MTTKTKLASYFETRKRGDESFVTLKPDRPEWLYEAVSAAHHKGDDLPNDWIYDECRAACSAIDDAELAVNEHGEPADDHGELHEYVEGRVDIYTRVLYQWQADMCQTSVYSEAGERLADMGYEGATGTDRVMALQYQAIEFIATTILTAWAENREDEDE